MSNKKERVVLYTTNYILLLTMLLKCGKCGHQWNYTGKSEYYASCPRCLNKVKVKEVKKDAV